MGRPRPTVIYRFDPDVQRYRLATPRYRARRAPALRRAARTALQARSTPGPDALFPFCDLWSAGLDLLYSGDHRVATQMLRALHTDRPQQERFRTELWALLRKRAWYLATARPDAPLLPR